MDIGTEFWQDLRSKIHDSYIDKVLHQGSPRLPTTSVQERHEERELGKEADGPEDTFLLLMVPGGSEKASNRKGYSIPFSKKQERSRRGVSSAGQPDTLTIWGCADNTDSRRESANRNPAVGSEAVRYRRSRTTFRKSPFQKLKEMKMYVTFVSNSKEYWHVVLT